MLKNKKPQGRFLKNLFYNRYDRPDAPEENENGRLYPFIQRNKVSVGDGAELISPAKTGRAFSVTELYSDKGEKIESAPHPGQKFFARVPFEVKVGDIMRAGEER